MNDKQSKALWLADELECTEGGWDVADACCAELRRLHAIEQQHKELLMALKGTYQELQEVLGDLNDDRMPHDGDEFHERLEKARAAIAMVEGGAA